jgi:ABC-type nitrate/sulfonate/bicarbonate transport system substrate-binding protein
MRRINRRRLLQSAAVAGMGLAGGFPGVPPRMAGAATPLTMQLDWKFNAQFAGLLLADHRGLYGAAGLDVRMEPWSSGVVVPDLVAANPAVLGCAEQNLVLAAQARGAPIRAVAAMFQASPLALMSLPERAIRKLSDLRGGRVGMHVDGVKVMALLLGAAGAAIEVVEISYEEKFERLLAGEYAAVQCYAVDEPIRFERASGIAPVVLPLHDLGHDAYAQVIIVHEILFRESPALVQKFLQATFTGWQLALAERAAAVRAVVEHYVVPGSDYDDVVYQARALDQVADYLGYGIDPGALGTIEAGRWARAAKQFADAGIIERVPVLEESLAVGFWRGPGAELAATDAAT